MLPWCPLVTMAILLSKCDLREAGFFCNSHPYEVYLVFELLWSAHKSSCTGKLPTKSMSTVGLVVLKIRLLDLPAQWIENQKRWVDVIPDWKPVRNFNCACFNYVAIQYSGKLLYICIWHLIIDRLMYC